MNKREKKNTPTHMRICFLFNLIVIKLKCIVLFAEIARSLEIYKNEDELFLEGICCIGGDFSDFGNGCVRGLL